MLLGELEPGMTVLVKRAGGGSRTRRRRLRYGGRLATFLGYDAEARRAVVKIIGGDVIRVEIRRLAQPLTL